MLKAEQPQFVPGALITKFVEPPFSVLDTRSGRWQERRRSWLSLGMQSELGRGAQALATGADRHSSVSMTAQVVGKGLISQATERRDDKVLASAGMLYDDEVHRTVARMGTDYDTEAGENAWGGSGTSIFDPVLCELAYRWWAPEGGRILDPFAGGSVRGLVAAMLGHPYTGIDLSGPQLAANRAQAGSILGHEHPAPLWLEGDTLEVLPTLEAAAYDMVMTCPPYYDLEVYSDDPRDLSNVAWGEFVALYAQAMASSARLLRDGRFSVWVVSEIRDEQGYCRGLVPLTVQVAEAAGLRLYNEAVLVNSPGSLPVRVTRYMEASRKLGRSHQNVLCFVKGSPPRGWSYERAAPPNPQLALFGLEPADAAEAPVASVPEAPAEPQQDIQPAPAAAALQPAPDVVLTFAPPEAWPADLAWDGKYRCEDHEAGYHATMEEASECMAGTYGEAGWVAEPEHPGLTPVEQHGEVWLKRDDLFRVAGVSGGKARTCWRLAQGASGLVTAGSRSSPQANIVAQVGRELGVPVRVHMPAGEATPEQAAAIEAGAAVVPHRPGHNSVIVARAREDAAARGWTEIPFGMECEAAVQATSEQVANLPAEAVRVVVPVGSGMTLAGITQGMAERDQWLPILGVVVGADPERRLARWAADGWRDHVTLVPSGSDYHQPADVLEYDGVALDAHYEAKAAAFLEPGDVLWCVGIRMTQALPEPQAEAAPPQAPLGHDAQPPAAVSVATPAPEPAPGATVAPSLPISWAEPEAGAQLRQLEDGRYVDTATGELYAARLTPVDAVDPGTLGLQPSGRLPVVSALRAPTSEAEWVAVRGREWNPGDRDRPCWECGRPPTGAYRDGSPAYDHSHNPQVLAMFAGEEDRAR